MNLRKSLSALSPLLGLLLLLSWGVAQADSREKIDSGSQAALQDLQAHVPGVDKLLDKAYGVLVFPDVVKMGFGAGSQYGEGALLVDDRPVAYYAIVGGPFGLGLGAHYKAQVVAFMTPDALAQFTRLRAWEVGRDGHVALLRPGAEGTIDIDGISDPVVGIVFSERGLSYNVSLRGNRFVRIAR